MVTITTTRKTTTMMATLTKMFIKTILFPPYCCIFYGFLVLVLPSPALGGLLISCMRDFS